MGSLSTTDVAPIDEVGELRQQLADQQELLVEMQIELRSLRRSHRALAAGSSKEPEQGVDTNSGPSEPVVNQPAADRSDSVGQVGSRRQLLRKGALAVGAGVAATALTTKPAAAANGDNLIIGQPNSGTNPTELDAASSDRGLVVTTATTDSSGGAVQGVVTAATGNAAGVIGETNSAGAGAGVFGQANATTGGSRGVQGITSAAGGAGVRGEAFATSGIAAGIEGFTDADEGAGVRGQAAAASGFTTGVSGSVLSTEGIGVAGQADAATGFTVGVAGASVSPDGVGVRGRADATTGVTKGLDGISFSDQGIGVRGQSAVATGVGRGVQGEATSPGGIGVWGLNHSATGGTRGIKGEVVSPDGTGVVGQASSTSGPSIGVEGLAFSPDGVGVFGSNAGPGGTGGRFVSEGIAVAAEVGPLGRSHLHLGGTLADPRTTTTAYSAGELVRDTSDNLWVCVDGGTPGEWRKVSGPDTAGSFHAITPKRVWDTRFQGGAMSNGESRTISIKDGRALSSSTVDVPDLVPAGATAITFNLAVVNTSADGFLAVTPGDAGAFTAASINWHTANSVLNNGTISTVDANRAVTVWCSGSTDFIIDITGYYL